MKPPNKTHLNALLSEAADIIRSAEDRDIPALLGEGIMDSLLKAIAAPKTNNDQTIYEYLLENKHRLTILALTRHAIHMNYSLKGKVGEIDVFVSPNYYQWFDDGVMFLQGKERFLGAIGIYQDGRVKFAIMKRDVGKGGSIGPEAVEFVDVEEMQERSNQPSLPENLSDLDAAIKELEDLLEQRGKDEALYQAYLCKHPWVLGAKYKKIHSHEAFDNENIPDFTGVRVHDSARDIFEIKQPFLPLFTKQNSFRAEFNNSWDQAERYLDFARRNAAFLLEQKGLRFDNPRCYLLLGYQLTNEQINEIRRKERMNPAITILTYDDLLVMARYTVDFLKGLKE